MSGIVLSASVRQNLLSLQSTADLLATTQNRLATGKKVNTALDNPTNFFTAQSLDNRASDINNLLDGIGNGVQVLQSANTGITSLQKLVDSAKSVANQALQAAVGYSQKSQVTTANISGATVDNLAGAGAPTNATLTGTTALNTLDLTGAAANLTFTVNAQTVSLAKGSAYTASQIVSAINTQVGTSAKVNASLNSSGQLVLKSTNTPGGADAVTVAGFSSGDATQLGFPAGASATASGTAASGLYGETLTIAATGNGTATSVTFGDGTNGTVKSLNDLNNALSANNLQASLSSTGALTISTTNDAASSTLGALGGSAAAAGALFAGLSGSAPVQDPTALANRANLVDQYNNILDQITTTAQDASYNGINLLNGDQLKLTFNETGTSTLKIQGVTFNAAGLNLTKLTAGKDFVDNASANATLKTLNNASGLLRTQASSLGSNLSIVQIRQDFSKNLINVLQTGSSNLTLADTNEEAANSQALSTRQSIAVSALALANQSQQSVLQLLR
jgi:flagellin